MIYLLVWIGLRLALQETFVCQENVCSFPTSFLAQFLGKHYHIDVSDQNSEDFGWPVNRDRTWTLMRHKVKVLAIMSPLSRFLRRFHRICRITWAAFLVSTIEERNREVHHYMARKKSRALLLLDQNAVSRITVENDPAAFCLALLDNEYRNMLDYLDVRPYSIYSLAQIVKKQATVLLDAAYDAYSNQKCRLAVDGSQASTGGPLGA